MSKKIGGVVALAGMCALSLFLLNCGSSSSRLSGLLYVLTQGSNGTGDSVSSFAIDLSSGNLSLINSNSSTCKPPGGSCGLPLNILLDPKGAAAFVLNQGIPSVSTPPTIYAYTVNSDGSLGTPTPAATLTPGDMAVAMTRDAAGSFLFVITAGNQSLVPPLAPQLLVFSVSSTSLTQVISAASTLTRIPTAISAITFPAPGSGTTPPCGFITSEEFLYVTSNQDLSPQHNDNTLSLYCVDSSGNLTDKTPNPPYNPQPNPLSVQAVNTNAAGQNSGGVFVYVGSQPTGSGALSIFQMCTVVGIAQCGPQDVTDAFLRPVGTAPTSTGQNPVGMVVDPTNNFLFVVCNGSSQVFGYLIDTTVGTLSRPANLPTGSQPVAIAMHSSGKFLYTSNNVSSNISAFTVSTTSGSMNGVATVNSPSGPRGMAAR
jgi:6-phosphogluconolactonase (cycloisomerase 2 family)